MGIHSSLLVKLVGFFATCLILVAIALLSAAGYFSIDAQKQQLESMASFIGAEKNMQREQLSAGLEQKAKGLAQLIAMIAVEPIQNYDFDVLKAYANSAVKDDDIGYVRILGIDNQVIAESNQLSKLTETSIGIIAEDEKLGTVIIGVKLNNTEVLINKVQERLGVFQAGFESISNKSRSQLLFWSIGLGVLVLMIALTITVIMVKGITSPMQQIILLFSKIGHGDYSSDISVNRSDEIGQVQQSLKDMQENLRLRIEADTKISREAQRIKVALNNVSGNIMVADESLNIIYMNKKLQDFLNEREAIIQKEIKGFSANNLISVNIDRFHQDPQRIRNILAELKTTHEGMITVGKLTFVLVINPVIDEQGKRIGFAVEWHDKTNQLEAENAIAQLIHDAETGRLNHRLNADHYQGFMRTMGQGINNILDTINAPINELLKTLPALADGDLTHRMTGQYSGDFATLQDAYNKSLSHLQNTVQQARTIAIEISNGSGEIAKGNDDLSRRTNDQAASLEETSSSMEEMTASVKLNAEHAANADQIAIKAQNHANEGNTISSSTSEKMDEISQASNTIYDIINVIDEIAFQTNLLALNAAVEAARAGDHGQGFAVVAGEVRSLAQRATDESRKIKRLIIQSNEKVTEGVELVESTSDALQIIFDSVKEVSEVVSKISHSSNEQSIGIEQVNTAVGRIDSVNQQNAALVEQAAATSLTMNDQAKELAKLMRSFKTE